ncbi:MAG: hypothetical protein NT027_06115 [Proteobacteria bacterium]|nr:hypothetical protein [Pseudomonadota bacterium]
MICSSKSFKVKLFCAFVAIAGFNSCSKDEPEEPVAPAESASDDKTLTGPEGEAASEAPAVDEAPAPTEKATKKKAKGKGKKAKKTKK